jgi:predicted alpha/beta-hydrolase family hydrolase
LSELSLTIPTSRGEARATVREGTRGLLCLAHGAGGGIDAPDLVAVADAAHAAGWSVARVEQPYRVAGRRAPAPARHLDEAWVDVVAALTARIPGPVVAGGRSSGARVACRTASAVTAVGVVALAFPLRPPRRPEQSRAGELSMVDVPLLVVQGDRDSFGGPGEFPAGVRVVAVPGDHSLRRSAAAVADAVVAWLAAQRVA